MPIFLIVGAGAAALGTWYLTCGQSPHPPVSQHTKAQERGGHAEGSTVDGSPGERVQTTRGSQPEGSQGQQAAAPAHSSQVLCKPPESHNRRSAFGVSAEERIISKAEFLKHQGRSSGEPLWICIRGKVLDVTEYQSDHPGSDIILQSHAGTDCTLAFDEVGHTPEARLKRDSLVIGRLTEEDMQQLQGDGASEDEPEDDGPFLIDGLKQLFKRGAKKTLHRTGTPRTTLGTGAGDLV